MIVFWDSGDIRQKGSMKDLSTAQTSVGYIIELMSIQSPVWDFSYGKHWMVMQDEKLHDAMFSMVELFC